MMLNQHRIAANETNLPPIVATNLAFSSMMMTSEKQELLVLRKENEELKIKLNKQYDLIEKLKRELNELKTSSSSFYSGSFSFYFQLSHSFSLAVYYLLKF